MRDFRKLAVWQKAHLLTLRIYAASAGFPRDEIYGLTSQLRRSASSIPANIAEGCGRRGDAELARFLDIAMGSASELEYHLYLAHELGYLTNDDEAVSLETIEVKRMLTGFGQRLRPRTLADS